MLKEIGLSTIVSLAVNISLTVAVIKLYYDLGKSNGKVKIVDKNTLTLRSKRHCK